MAMDQSSKLGLGTGTSAVAVYGNYQVIIRPKGSHTRHVYCSNSTGNTREVLIFARKTNSRIQESPGNDYYNSATTCKAK